MTYDDYIEILHKIYSIVKEYYGEEHTDLQEASEEDWEESPSYIMIWFPEVEITNSREERFTIRDLYVRLVIKDNAHLQDFQMTVATFTNSQWLSDYAHSHLPGITSFQHPCLGSGPIGSTIHMLQTEDFEEVSWEILCSQIEDFVKWESVEGGPYRYIRDITNRQMKAVNLSYFCVSGERDVVVFGGLKDFTVWLLHTHIKDLDFLFDGERYTCTMDYVHQIDWMTRYFVEWISLPNNAWKFNDRIASEILEYGQIKNGQYYTQEALNSTFTPQTRGMFKGTPIQTRLLNQEDSELPYRYVHSHIVKNIINTIENFITLYFNNYEQYAMRLSSSGKDYFDSFADHTVFV